MALATSSATYCARLTPESTGAIATLALCGPGVYHILEQVFHPAEDRTPQEFCHYLREQAKPGRFWFGRMGEEKNCFDEVVLSLKSKSPIPTFEVHCHGGRQIIALLQECLTARGVELCTWESFQAKTLDSKIKALALAALSKVATTRTATIVLDQYHGALEQSLRSIQQALASDRRQAGRMLHDLARWISLGTHLTNPWNVVVAGAPNVGKSSVINRLAGYARCIVSPTPGTTRDVVTMTIALDGWPINLIDTAGIRDEPSELEELGIELAHSAAATADLCLWLVDASTEHPVWPEVAPPNLCRVVNKIDLPPRWPWQSAPEKVAISAKTGAGLELLCSSIVQRLVGHTPPPGAAVPFTNESCAAVTSAIQHAEADDWERVATVMGDLLR